MFQNPLKKLLNSSTKYQFQEIDKEREKQQKTSFSLVNFLANQTRTIFLFFYFATI